MRARVAAVAVAVLAGLAAREARAGEVEIVPARDGRIGAWLVTDRVRPPGARPRAGWSMDADLLAGAREEALVGRAGQALPALVAARLGGPVPAWKVATPAPGALAPGAVALNDGARRAPEAFAYAYGELVLASALDGALLVSANDGVRAWVDGEKVLDVDGARPIREDAHVVPLELAAGAHRLLFRVHARTADEQLAVRVVDASLAAPKNAVLRLPGTSDSDAPALAARLASARIEAGLAADGLHPRATVRFAAGMPRGVPRAIRADVRWKGAKDPIASRDLGEVPVGPDGAGEVTVDLPEVSGSLLDDAREVVIAVDVGGERFSTTVRARPSWRDAVEAIDRALPLCDRARSPFLDDPDVTRATLAYLRDRLRGFVDRGERDVALLDHEARDLVAYADDLAHGRDPLRSHAGIRRFAYLSPIDDAPSPFGVYVPPSYRPGGARKYPLVVALHGMNGRPLSMIRWFFGEDDERADSEWEDRHPGDVDPIDAFVVAPNAFGNAMYRELGEVDVMAVLDWAERFFPIDPRRVTITGVSMGGTGAAWIPLRHPDRFAAAAPLCGYHSYLIRRDLFVKGLRPWERRLAEDRSNALWAENGLHLPMFVWHGRRDLPVENSEVLVRRYDELGYPMRVERPDVGHDVWRQAYADGLLWKWLEAQRAPERRTRVVFRTDDLRWRGDAWLAIDALAEPRGFGEIDARIEDRRTVRVRTQRVDGLSIDRDEARLSPKESVAVVVDGQKVVFAPGQPIALHREEGAWKEGAVARPDGAKRPGLAGPIRDVFHEPLTFVIGTDDPAQTRANEEAARHWARIRPGVDAAYPIVRDVDLDDATAARRSLVLVGNSRSNVVLRALEDRLPFRVENGAVVARDGRRFGGPESGVVFVHPNPAHPDRYVLVIEGTSPIGTLRATSLPDLLPDWIVYDRRIAGARGAVALGATAPLAAGAFRADWSLPPQ